MNILWVVNNIFPAAAKKLGLNPPVFGGWMYGLASDLVQSGQVNLAVATIHNGKELKSFKIDDINYFLIPKHKKDNSWKEVIENFHPNIVHIHGTEYNYGMSLMTVYPNLKYVISIQGLVSIIHRYFLSGMSTWDVIRNITLRDILRWNTLFHTKHDFFKQGLVEKEYLRRATAVIGRTEWDHANVIAINPKTNYYFCNESLRDEFYTGEKWSIENCTPHSIFLSQASYPLKGLHQVIKAVAILKEIFPNIHIKIAGPDITKEKTLKDRLKRSGYGHYIGSMIKTYKLKEHISFLGPLQATQMKSEYLNSHVFISPSSIENGSNSIGEAQILGVPVISSFVGGVTTTLKNSISARIYEFYSYEVLAAQIRETFTSTNPKKLEIDLKTAMKRHNRKTNSDRQIEIYKNIIF